MECGDASAASASLDPEIESFIEKLVSDHGFNRRQMRGWFNQARVQSGVLKAMSRPATARPWYEYRAGQVTEARILGGLDYWQRHADTLERASIEYGVPEEIANMALFLASDEASYVNGQHIAVDGGLTSSMPVTGRIGR